VRKFLIIALLLSLFIATFATVSAQDEEGSVACTEEELTLTTEALGIYNDGLATLQEDYDLSGDPTDNAYGETIIALDAISYEFWNTVYPELPACNEAQSLAFVLGFVYDEYLTIGLLSNASAWVDANGDAEGATVFADQATMRWENLTATMEGLSEVTLTDLTATIYGDSLEYCTEEQITALNEGLSTTMTNLGGVLTEMSEQPTLAFAVTEGASYAFDTEIYAEAANCYENQGMAWYVSDSLHELNIIMGLSANAVAEAEGGNTDVAQAMVDSAGLRLENFQEDFAALSEMSAPAE
jgi:hypothetical protein